jgi:hypothetical protein
LCYYTIKYKTKDLKVMLLRCKGWTLFLLIFILLTYLAATDSVV